MCVCVCSRRPTYVRSQASFGTTSSKDWLANLWQKAALPDKKRVRTILVCDSLKVSSQQWRGAPSAVPVPTRTTRYSSIADSLEDLHLGRLRHRDSLRRCGGGLRSSLAPQAGRSAALTDIDHCHLWYVTEDRFGENPSTSCREGSEEALARTAALLVRRLGGR